MQSTTAGVRTARLGPGLTTAVRHAVRPLGCTTFMTAAALLAVALARRGAQRDFLFAFPWAGRDDGPTAMAIGMFVNTLVLRVDLAAAGSWRALLARVRENCLAAYRQADVPFDEVAAALHPGRDLSRPALTPVYLSVEEGRDQPASPAGTTARYLDLDPLHLKYELELVATDLGDDIEVAMTYAVGLFEPATAAMLLDDLVTAARDLAADPDAHPLEETAMSTTAAAEDRSQAGLIESVRRAWADVLDLDSPGQVPVDVNFLEAGGSSLLLIMLWEQLEPLTTRMLRVSDLFEHGTVRRQAALLADDEPAEDLLAGTVLDEEPVATAGASE
ncbi:condensation domain-containing protein [Plantactinospora sp. KBS50]|uniref:condensation domain-containing protein n=1 Tax=Plantactinospora sp. KBS50 TaxID=2024580 RepID=UPI000BAAA26A|nr:condensation domain-containing protein [Plantactinospora sp. KBS50]ASW54763.1 hypothetical protein CIK06_12115 [Plantactinospora sp. KBS50]